MPSDPRLIIPLDALPGVVSAGSPVVMTGYDGRSEVGQYVMATPSGHFAWSNGSHGGSWAAGDRIALLLSPPPLDASGYPLRVDGVDVAARMLARAMGMEPGPVTWLSADGRQ